MAAGCAPSTAGSSLVVGGSVGFEPAAPGGVEQPPVFKGSAVGAVPAEELVAADLYGNAGGVLMLVSVGSDELTVRWPETFAPQAAGLELGWFAAPADGSDEPEWGVVASLDAGERSYTIWGLDPATRYELVLTAMGADRTRGESAEAVFETLAPPVRDLAASPLAPDAMLLSWNSPSQWAPMGDSPPSTATVTSEALKRIPSSGMLVGYVLQWRRYGAEAFGRRLELPAGRREQTVTGLVGGVDYEFRVTALTEGGGQSEPAAIVVRTPPAPDESSRTSTLGSPDDRTRNPPTVPTTAVPGRDVEEQSDLPDDPTARAIITCGTDLRCLQHQFDCSVVDPDCVGRRLDEYFSSGVDDGD